MNQLKRAPISLDRIAPTVGANFVMQRGYGGVNFVSHWYGRGAEDIYGTTDMYNILSIEEATRITYIDPKRGHTI
jgi:hypothetical protein